MVFESSFYIFGMAYVDAITDTTSYGIHKKHYAFSLRPPAHRAYSSERAEPAILCMDEPQLNRLRIERGKPAAS